MRQAMTLTTSLLAAAAALPEKASAEDVQAALGQTDATKQEHVDPDSLVMLSAQQFTDWRRAAADFCLQADEPADAIGEQFIEAITDYMRLAPLVDRMYEDFSGSQFAMCLAQPGTMPSSAYAVFLPQADVAMIDPLSNEPVAVAFGLHELRHGWQDINGVFDRMPEDSRQDRFAMLYMIEADATAFSIAAAYQLRQQGEPAAWQVLQNRYQYRDMAVAFEESLSDIPADQPLTDDQVKRGMRAAFNAFFDNTTFPSDLTAFHAERWAHYPDRTTDKTAELRHLTQVIGQLPGTNGRNSGYIGAAEIAKALDAANELVPMKTPAPQQGSTIPTVERQP